MVEPHRTTTEKPYPFITGLIRPVKTVLIVAGMLSGLAWLVGSLIDNALSDNLILAVAALCIAAFAVYFFVAVYSTHKRERFAERCERERKANLAQFEADGFVPTRKFIGSARLFLVDEAMGKWVLMDYFNHPGEAELHDISSIIRVETALNRDWVPREQVVLLSNGGRLGKKDSDEYFSKTGVLLILNDADSSTAFINCFKTENDVELIVRYVESLLANG